MEKWDYFNPNFLFMKGLRSIPRILKINNIEGYRVSCLFNNGESRIIDFSDLFQNVFKINPKHPAIILIEDKAEFGKIKIIGSTLGWEDVGLFAKNEKGETVFYPYDLDPIVLYENSISDDERNVLIGLKIREERKNAGLTQEELARRSGTNKHYISRLENNKSDIELLTLKKIIEAGLGKKLTIQIS